MTTKTVASTKFDLSTTSVIMKATSYPDDNTYSFPQHDNMDIFIKEETDDCEQDRRKVENEERHRKKRELNRLAAQRSREKRRLLIKQLEEQVNELEKCNDSLQSEIAEMRDEMTQLDFLLQNHACTMRQ